MTSIEARLADLGRWPRLGLAVFLGTIAAVGLAPFNLPVLSMFGFAGLIGLIAIQTGNWKTGWTALAGAIGYFGLSLSWIVEPFLVDPLRHGWMAPFALLFLSAGMGLFWVSAAVLAKRIGSPSIMREVLALSIALTVAEVLRANILSGFPWAHPGHIWIGSPLMHASSIIGAHGLTLITLLAAAGGMLAVVRHVAFAALPFCLFLGLGTITYLAEPVPRIADDAPIVRLVQPNAPQHLKWLPEMIPVFFDRALDLTRGVDPGARVPDLVIWPETSLPPLLRNSGPWREAISDAAGGAEVIVGGQRIGEDGLVRNAALYLDSDGQVVQIYDKHHLVPFGEYFPLAGVARQLGLRGLADVIGSGYAPGSGPDLLDLGPLGMAFPMICYETIFPGYIRQVDRPDWMVQITNDAWFGEMSGPYQHLELAQLRAVEQGLPLLRVANTGITAVINARGQVLESLALGTQGALDVAIPPALPPTVYAQFGNTPVYVLLILLLGLIAFIRPKNAH